MKFIPYICAGDPTLAFSEKLIRTLAPYADAIEIGIPFSDPIADGKTIQEASQRALQNKTTPSHVLSLVQKLRQKEMKKPIYLMTYANIVHAFGSKKFFQQMQKAQ
ncbi:MAG: tryptophan synthase subunit alpha, partial [Candidatus Diapherotrites archaeon]|nr:tryptophan synthase subunit alpha [Candidatus Diapherotrites archaeon]